MLEIDEAVPEIMQGYELCDMDRLLWMVMFPNGKVMGARIAGGEYVTASADVNNVVAASVNCPRRDGKLVQRKLGFILSRRDCVEYFAYPKDYQIHLRNPGERP